MWTGGHTERRTDSQVNFYDENGGNFNEHNTKRCGLAGRILFIVKFFLIIWEEIRAFGALFYFFQTKAATLPQIRPQEHYFTYFPLTR